MVDRAMKSEASELPALVQSEVSVNCLNELSARCRQANDTWWHDPLTGELITDRNVGELLMLIVSEISEAKHEHVG